MINHHPDYERYEVTKYFSIYYACIINFFIFFDKCQHYAILLRKIESKSHIVDYYQITSTRLPIIPKTTIY